MSKIERATNILLTLLMVFIESFFLKVQVSATVQIEEMLSVYNDKEIVITFEGVADFEKFYKKMQVVQSEFECRSKKFANIRQISVYELLISEFEGIFYSNILKPCVGNNMGMVKEMCRAFAKIAVGVPEFIHGAGGELIFLDYDTVKENFQKIVMDHFAEAEKMLSVGRLDIFPIKMTLAPVLF